MWRALFLALGVSCCILGMEALAVAQATLNVSKAGAGGAQAVQRVVQPPDWAPWSLMSAGAVVIIYSFTIPARQAAK